MDRRSYPDDRGPPTAPPVPPPQPPPRVEKKPEIKNIDDILKLPGRLSRPERVPAITAILIHASIPHSLNEQHSLKFSILTDCHNHEGASRKRKNPCCKAHTGESSPSSKL